MDDGYEPERCAANTQRFLSDDVFALFGYVGTSTSMAALPLLQKARVPLFAPLTGADALRQPQLAHLVFNVRASYADETALMVRHLTDRKSTRLNSSHLVISYAVFCLKKKRGVASPCSVTLTPPLWGVPA